MPRHKFSKPVPFTAREMFDMVADVASYHEFLPLCTASDVIGVKTDDQGISRFKGTLRIEKPSIMLNETFTSDVTTNPNDFSVLAVSSSGPIKRLSNTWRFIDLEKGGSQAIMELDFEMSSLPLRILMKASFDPIMAKLTDAFEKRAYQLYRK